MKYAIYAACLLIPLAIVFLIIERKDIFPDHDIVVQEETATGKASSQIDSSEPKPVSLMTGTEHAEATPVTETGHIEEPSVAENKQSDTETATEATSQKTHTAETDPAIEDQEESGAHGIIAGIKFDTDKMPAPVAIPVATEEEARKLNTNAIDFLNTKKGKNDETFMEGKIIAISQCPTPADLDYPDCNLSAKVLLNDTEQTTICLVIPCIRSFQKVLPDTLREGGLISFRMLDEDTLSEDETNIQLVDDDPSFELDYLFVDQIEPILKYSKISKYAKKKQKDIEYDKTIVLTDKDQKTRQEYMNRELERLNRIISGYSTEDAKIFSENFSEFTKDMETKHPYAETQYDDGSKKIFPVEVTVSVKNYLKWALSNDAELMSHNARVIASVEQFLRERGIILLVVPVPYPYESYANKFHLSEELSTYNINRILFMQDLLKRGVEVLDFEPIIEKNIDSRFHFFRILEKDVHLSEMGAYLLAQHIYDHLKQYDFLEKLIRDDYSITPEPVKEKVIYYGEQFGDMDSMSMGNSNHINKQSPFLIVGDSFSISSHIQNYLSYFLKTKVYGINRNSSFPTTARLLQLRNSEISPNTKVCILINFSAHLGHRFLDFFQEGIQIYPNETLRNSDLISIDCKELLEKDRSFSFSLPENLAAAKTYKVLVYTKTNAMNLDYRIGIDSQSTNSITIDPQGLSCTEVILSAESTQLRLHISASPKDDKTTTKEDSYFQITRIVLVEE